VAVNPAKLADNHINRGKTLSVMAAFPFTSPYVIKNRASLTEHRAKLVETMPTMTGVFAEVDTKLCQPYQRREGNIIMI
jgi:hypothetical protein